MRGSLRLAPISVKKYMVDTLSLISVCIYRCKHNHVDDIDKSVNKSCTEYCFWYL